VKTSESLEQALARELREELDVTLLRAVPISRVEHAYGGGMGSLTIIFFAVAILESELHPGPFERVAWVLPRELSQYDFLAANGRIIAELATGRIRPAELLASAPSDLPPNPPPDSH
jgi:8-oxo-dGTP diphosphatase